MLNEQGLCYDCLTNPILVYQGNQCNYGFPNPTSIPTPTPHKTHKPQHYSMMDHF